MHAWHWLVVNGLYRDLIAAGIGLVVTHAVAWRPLRKAAARQERIADLLDTDSPGGLADVKGALEKLGEHDRRKPPPPGPHVPPRHG